MKKAKKDFSREFAIYKNTRKVVHNGRYIYEYVLVKRGFYSRLNTIEKANLLRDRDSYHFVSVRRFCGESFWADWHDDIVDYVDES